MNGEQPSIIDTNTASTSEDGPNPPRRCHPWKLAAHVEAAGFVDVALRDNEDYDAWSSDAGKRLIARMFTTALSGIAAKGGITAEERDRLVGNLEGIFDGSTVVGMQLRWVWGRRPE